MGIGYYDYHLMTNIAYYDYIPDSRFKLSFYYIRIIGIVLSANDYCAAAALPCFDEMCALLAECFDIVFHHQFQREKRVLSRL